MKKILFFLLFGITFSLCGVSIKAYAAGNFGKANCYYFTQSGDKYAMYAWLIGDGPNHPDHMSVNYNNYNSYVKIDGRTPNNCYLYQLSYNGTTLATINEWYNWNELGALYYNQVSTNITTYVPIYSHNITWNHYEWQQANPYIYEFELPVNIYECAFFFEPEPNTDLFSMYCFPQALDVGEVVTVYYNNLNNVGFEITSASVNTLKRCYINNNNTRDYYYSIQDWLEMIDDIKLENDNVIDFLFTTPIYAVYCNFIENNGNPNYNIFPLSDEEKWDEIKNQIGFDDTTLGYIWDWLFGDPGHDGHSVTIENGPSPTPLPTPIPYRVILVPDGNGGYEIQYIYEDENGNTVTSSNPPTQPEYNGDALITSAPNIMVSGVPISDVEGVQSLIDVLGTADSEYSEGIEAVTSSFLILPPKWFLFFGIPGAIIILAGIIKSLLG